MDHKFRTRVIWVLLSLVGVIDLYALRKGLPGKIFFGYLSAAITISGYAFYISQMYPRPGATPAKPEPLSWLLFGFLTATGAVVQVMQGAQAGSWCLLITGGACFLIAGWSYLRWQSEWHFDRFHKLVAAGAIVLFAFSMMTSRSLALATLSAVLATLADLVSYLPTFKKARARPYEDSYENFFFNSIKCIPALLALESYSIATTVYLLMLLVVNGAFAAYLFFQQRRWAQ